MVKNIKANDSSLKSWLEISRESDFPIQNLPFGIYSTKNKTKRVGVATLTRGNLAGRIIKSGNDKHGQWKWWTAGKAKAPSCGSWDHNDWD